MKTHKTFTFSKKTKTRISKSRYPGVRNHQNNLTKKRNYKSTKLTALKNQKSLRSLLNIVTLNKITKKIQ